MAACRVVACLTSLAVLLLVVVRHTLVVRRILVVEHPLAVHHNLVVLVASLACLQVGTPYLVGTSSVAAALHHRC